MRKSGFIDFVIAILGIVLVSVLFTNCKKPENRVKYPHGTFPDTIINMADINSAYDDYNIALYQLGQTLPIIFSSNRKSSGGQFDLEQGSVTYMFDQTTGVFGFGSKMTTDAFLAKLIGKATTTGDDFGPYRLFSLVDGYEYLILASVNAEGNLDLFYLKNQPASGSILPDVSGPYPVKLMNTAFDDEYLCFNFSQDTAYFASNKDGNFDIFSLVKPADQDLTSWFNLDYTLPVRVDSINSSGNDQCPFIFKNIMVFTSNRIGGLGGYDLYYSIMHKGKWSSPVNFGPRINTSYDEFRPVIGYDPSFTNYFLMFSSNRPGGKGKFDLYFTGIEFPSDNEGTGK
jgi:WD40-like Beta Propeller Repeat